MTEVDEFKACTVKKKHKYGRTEIQCKLGLWDVDAYHEINAVAEAMRYFRQYKSDGEYNHIIGGESAVDKLMRNSC